MNRKLFIALCNVAFCQHIKGVNFSGDGGLVQDHHANLFRIVFWEMEKGEGRGGSVYHREERQ